MHLAVQLRCRHGRTAEEAERKWYQQRFELHFEDPAAAVVGRRSASGQRCGQLRNRLRPHAVSSLMTATRAVTVTLTPADGPSTLTLASARLNYAIAGWLRGEPQLLPGAIAFLPLLPEGSVVVKSWEVDAAATKSERAHATSETDVRFSFVPPTSILPNGPAAESLVELLTLTMNGCSLGPPGSFFHTPSSLMLHGPSGIGKTHLIRNICGALQLNYFPLSLVSLLALPHPTEPLARIFATIRDHTPAVVLIEDLDAATSIEETSILTVTLPPLLTGLSALLDTLRVFVVAEARDVDTLLASIRNSPWLSRRIEMPLPTPAQRTTLLASFLAASPALEPMIRTVAYRCAGFLPRDLQRLATLARALAADKELTIEHLTAARTQLPPSQLADYLPALPSITWDDVGGSEEIRQAFRETFEWPQQHGSELARLGVVPASGLLLYGPSGCGKTLAVYALANSSPVNFLTVKGPELFSKYLGDTERTVRKLFNRARKMAPCIVFFDELDAISARRGGGDDGESGVSERVLTQLLTEMDGIADKKKVTVIGCSRRPDLIDSALLRPGRLDAHIFVDLPDEPARKDILRVLSRRMPLHPTVDLAALSGKLEGFSGADLATLLREAALETSTRGPTATAITMEGIYCALQRVHASIGIEELRRFEKFRAQLL